MERGDVFLQAGDKRAKARFSDVQFVSALVNLGLNVLKHGTTNGTNIFMGLLEQSPCIKKVA